MTSRGRRVALEQAPTGARLALDVCDAAGLILVAAGTEIDEELRALLLRRGVSKVYIETPISAEEAAVQRRKIAQHLARLFRLCHEDPVMRRLHDEVLAHRLEQLR